MKTFRNLGTTLVILTGVVLGISVTAQPQGLGLEQAAAVKAARGAQLLGMQGVVGAGIGLDNVGQGAVHILVLDEATAARMPRTVDGVSAVIHVTGQIFALGELEAIAAAGPAGKPTGARVDPTAYFERPVPIGVSTGNATPGTACSAGTIGCRVRKGGHVFALSNNHVYGRENAGAPGEAIAQPGPFDTRCYVSPTYFLGTLADFVEISFSQPNVVDAAIAATTTDHLDNKTPWNGYGIPSSQTATAELNQAVQKYGRTTGLTKGIVSGVDLTINVGYGAGNAVFTKQIMVYSRKAFLKSGDSGSLMVTESGRNPVGLLFAGNTTGQYAFANPIGDVLNEFGVTIDGQ